MHLNGTIGSNMIKTVAASLLVGLSGWVWAQDAPSECVEMGALAFDNWTKSDAGGTGSLPAGEANSDYLRCKACHGWDRLGTDGGYVRRSRTGTRPNAGDGDGDSTSRAIATGSVTADQVLHAGTGRSFAEGTGSWVARNASPSAANTAAHTGGFTLGNQHPDFSDGTMTQAQIDCLVEFLNFEDADAGTYFAAVNPAQNPVLYTLVGTADAAAGASFFDGRCTACHDLAFATDYVQGDGKYSELAHKARWGIPNTQMTRGIMGDPTAQDIVNLMAYLQQQSGTGFAVNPGLTGTWYNADREGEGFLLEFGYSNAELTLFASFYTYDDMGNQAWLVASPTGSGPVSGDSVAVDVFLVTGPMWGDDFDEADRNVVAWGTGEFTFPSCNSGHVALTPGPEGTALGFTNLEYDLSRDLLVSGIECPTAP
jgi:cytochrome c2